MIRETNSNFWPNKMSQQARQKIAQIDEKTSIDLPAKEMGQFFYLPQCMIEVALLSGINHIDDAITLW